MLDYVEEQPFPANSPSAFHDTVVMRFHAARNAPAHVWEGCPEPPPLSNGGEI